MAGDEESYTLEHSTFYVGRGNFFGDPATVTINCDHGVWTLIVAHEPGSACAFTDDHYVATSALCDPIELRFTGVDFCGRVVDLIVTE